jgi:GntR family transcriptional regulator
VACPATGAPGLDVILELDPRSPVPPYEQLRQQITALLLGGGLAAGDRLPAIRQLANDLGIASGTVARAYRELEGDGVVATKGRHGTIVQGAPRRPAPPADVLEAARSYADEVSRSGASLEDALIAVRVAFAAARTA